jgi:carboxyl-terminal processing protease
MVDRSPCRFFRPYSLRNISSSATSNLPPHALPVKIPFPRFLRSGLVLLLLAAWTTVLAVTDRKYTTTPLMSSETRALVQMLEYYHYNKDAVGATDYAQLVTEYMSDLDPQRLFFTAQDEQALRQQYSPRLMTDLAYLGNIDAAFAIFRLYEERVQARSAWIFNELGKDIDLAGKDFYAPDRSKAPWPATGAEADDLWHRRLKFEMLPDFLGGKAVTEAKATARKRHERMLKNLADIDASDIQEAYLTSLTKMYDPHSSYFSADTYDDFGIQMRLSLIGIGAVLGLDDDGNCVVREIVPGAPADLSKQIKVNDKIMIVQQPGEEPVEVVGMKLRRIVDMIRGKKNTKVILTIQSPDVGAIPAKARPVTIVRDDVKLNASRATASIYDLPADGGGTAPVGVITLNSFYGPADESSDQAGAQSSASKDVAELVGKLKQAGVKALVIDLRRNGGGLLSEAVSLTGLFVGKGPVVQVRDSLGHLAVDNNTETPLAYDGPVAVLTSRFSASASEIFAGALQNYGRAVIIGDSSTHGKGTVQAVLEMKNYVRFAESANNRTGAAKLTIQKFYLPNGASTQKKGVIPDITLPSIDDYLPYVGESSLPHALLWDEIKSTPFAGQPLTRAFVAPLVQASHDRQQSLEEFSLLQQNVTHFKDLVEQKLVSLNLEQRKAEKVAATDFKKHIDTELARLAKGDYPHREIKLNAVVASEPAPEPPAAKADDGDTDGEDADTSAKFDIHLRESMRVVLDAARLSKDPQYWANGAAPLAPAGATHG